MTLVADIGQFQTITVRTCPHPYISASVLIQLEGPYYTDADMDTNVDRSNSYLTFATKGSLTIGSTGTTLQEHCHHFCTKTSAVKAYITNCKRPLS